MKGGDKRGRENQSTCKYLIVTISTLKKKLTYLIIYHSLLSQGSPPVLILPSSLHRDIALSLVEANLHHLSGLPGGWDYNPLGSTISKVCLLKNTTLITIQIMHK